MLKVCATVVGSALLALGAWGFSSSSGSSSTSFPSSPQQSSARGQASSPSNGGTSGPTTSPSPSPPAPTRTPTTPPQESTTSPSSVASNPATTSSFSINSPSISGSQPPPPRPTNSTPWSPISRSNSPAVAPSANSAPMLGTLAENLDGGGRRGGDGYMPDEGSRLGRNPEPYAFRLGRNPEPYQPRDVNQHLLTRTIKIMSYNIWFREDVEVHERMKAIGRLIQQHSPDVILFQEVTPIIYRIIQSSSWWNSYESSVSPYKATRRYFCMLLSKLPVREFISNPFENSTMGRELCVAKIDAGMGKKLIAATTHLESPTPLSMNSEERIAQAREAIGLLNYPPNVVFGGDMNWDDITDGPFPLLDGWVDAWAGLRPTEKGLTYDTKTNRMLCNRPLQKRLDRFVCKLSDFRLVGVEMIGMEAVPRISYFNQGKVLPVYPSDHYGLLLTVGIK